MPTPKDRTEMAVRAALEAPLIERVVVPVEGSSEELLVQEWAASLALGLNAQVAAYHVTPHGSKFPGDLFVYLKNQCKKHKIPFESKILTGADVVDEMIQEIGPMDLVVIGTRRLANGYHLGSVTDALIRRSPCPVQVIRI